MVSCQMANRGREFGGSIGTPGVYASLHSFWMYVVDPCLIQLCHYVYLYNENIFPYRLVGHIWISLQCSYCILIVRPFMTYILYTHYIHAGWRLKFEQFLSFHQTVSQPNFSYPVHFLSNLSTHVFSFILSALQLHVPRVSLQACPCYPNTILSTRTQSQRHWDVLFHSQHLSFLCLCSLFSVPNIFMSNPEQRQQLKYLQSRTIFVLQLKTAFSTDFHAWT